MALSQMQIPTVITSSILSLVVGAGIGALTMFYLGYDPRDKPLTGGTEDNAPPGGEAKGGPPGKGKGGGPPGMGKGGGGPGGGKGKGGPGGPPGGMGGMGGMGAGMMGGMAMGGMMAPQTPKVQLADLVTKLDQLTAKSLSITLTDEQRAKLSEQLKGLSDSDELSEEDAKKRLDAILDVMKGQKETLEAAGYRWPGTTPQRPAEMPDNPFSEGDNAKHLKNLETQIGKGKSK